MAGVQLWDREKTEWIPIEDVRQCESTLLVVTLSAALMRSSHDTLLRDRAGRILVSEFALLELDDGVTMLVERISEFTGPSNGDQPHLVVEYLVVG